MFKKNALASPLSWQFKLKGIGTVDKEDLFQLGQIEMNSLAKLDITLYSLRVDNALFLIIRFGF